MNGWVWTSILRAFATWWGIKAVILSRRRSRPRSFKPGGFLMEKKKLRHSAPFAAMDVSHPIASIQLP